MYYRKNTEQWYLYFLWFRRFQYASKVSPWSCVKSFPTNLFAYPIPYQFWFIFIHRNSLWFLSIWVSCSPSSNVRWAISPNIFTSTSRAAILSFDLMYSLPQLGVANYTSANNPLSKRHCRFQSTNYSTGSVASVRRLSYHFCRNSIIFCESNVDILGQMQSEEQGQQQARKRLKPSVATKHPIRQPALSKR